MKQLQHYWAKSIFAFILLIGFLPVGLAQGLDTEPNSECTTPQDMGMISLPSVIEGSLDVPDVDFFRFNGQPGARVRFDYEGEYSGQRTLTDPYLGVFDSACNLLKFNDDRGNGPDSRLQIAFPADGILILAATSFFDESFSGEGRTGGTYTINLTSPPAPRAAIGSITGRVVDAYDGAPLKGNVSPYANVELYRCNDTDCSEYVDSKSTSKMGRFKFDKNYSGIPFKVGTYQVRASAERYKSRRTKRFEVKEGEHLDVGDIELLPPEVQLSVASRCEDLPAAGGECLYSVNITNTSPAALSGLVWSLVNSYDVGSSSVGNTDFQAGEQHIQLEPGSSIVAEFMFSVPSTVRDGGSICTEAFFGKDPAPYFTPEARQNLFCIQKGDEVFQPLVEEEARKLFGQRKGIPRR